MQSDLINGFLSAFQFGNFLFALLGVTLGSLVGVLPGIGPLGAMSLLLTAIYGLTPTQTFIFFAGIYYGSMYGGSTTSIILNVPGEAASVVTCLDGYKMTQKGRAGAALFTSAAGSFVAGTLSVLGLMLFAPPLSELALEMGPPELFCITAVGLLLLTYITSGSKIKAATMVVLGIILSTIGMDPTTGAVRFTFGIFKLSQGIEFISVAIGLFGISEIIKVLVEDSEDATVKKVKLREMLPTREEVKRSLMPWFRGTAIGFCVGLIPGPAAVIASFSSYALEKRLSKNPAEFGNGAIEGVAGPEAANNSAAGAAFLPLVAIGIPFAPPMALVLAALLIGGVIPGPSFIKEHGDIFWTFIASMYIGNVLLFILNLPLIGLFVSVLRIPVRILMPVVTVVCIIGVYSSNSSSIDVWTLVLSGIGGYLLRARGYDLAPLLLSLVIGPKLEIYFRQSLFMSGGELSVFISRPISLVILLAPAFLVVAKLTWARVWKKVVSI
jgi:putative tricarboxylic transport membrane protein